MPYFGAGIGLGVLCVFATRVPITSKLYKEAGYSLGIGLATASAYPYYYRRTYDEKVSNTYFWLKARFDKFPDQNIPDGDNVAKNFGMSKWNDNDIQGEEELMMMNANSEIFEGGPDDHRKEMKDEMLESIM